MLIQQLPGVDFRPSITTPDGTVIQLPTEGPLHPVWLELMCYLGKRFRSDWCTSSDSIVQEEFARYPSADAFYRESEVYLYHLLGYWLEGCKRPAHAWLLQSTGNVRCSVLDYGCGVGCDGLWLLDAGYDVSFADIPSPSLEFLRWRLRQRWYYGSPVYEVPLTPDVPQHTFVWAMDVLEHLPPAEHEAFLMHLASLGRFVLVNLIDDKAADGTVHHPVDVEGLTAFLRERGSLVFQDHYLSRTGNRTRFVCYGPEVPAALIRQLTPQGTGMLAEHEEEQRATAP